MFREDGYINMTKACAAFGKRITHFWDNASTDEYLVALHHALAKNTRNSGEFNQEDVRLAVNYLVEFRRGRTGGTFCHPKLAVFFARWLDVRFAVWCDLMIDNILQGHIQTTVVVPVQGNTQYDSALSI